MYQKRIIRIILTIFFLTVSMLNIENISLATDVENFDEFYKTYTDPNCDGNIDLKTDIETESSIGCPAKNSLSICGNNHTLNGNSNEGITLESGKELSIDSITAENFHNENNGGFINNENGCRIEKMQGNFHNNSSSQEGGVLYNNSQINNIEGEFNNNESINNGGAIYNDGNGNINNVDARFENNRSTNSTGGAICNFGNIKNVNAYFNQNKSDVGNGGAIFNYGKIENIEGKFENNSAYESGGAIYNLGSIGKIKGEFISNSSDTKNIYMGGGAINNYGTIEKLSGRFENNKTEGYGGAIHNSYGTINLISDEEEIVFLNNSDSTGSNAIFNDSGYINLNAGDYDIIINDTINGADTYSEIDSTININSPEVSESNYGNVIINNKVSNNHVNMYAGTLKFGQSQTGSGYGTFSKSVNFNYYGGTVDFRDNNIRNTNLGKLTLNNDMDLKLDGNFEDFTIDTFTVDSFTSNGHYVNISDILLMTTTDEKKFTLSPIGENIDESVRNLLKESIKYSAGDVINSPVYRYRTWYDSQTGLINFERIENNKYNPSILASPVAAQLGGYLTQLNSYEEAFRKMDIYMLMTRQQRLALRLKNRYAEASNVLLKSEISLDDNKYGWIRPYTIIERVPLKNGPRVSNTAYGTFFGLESKLIQLRNRWDIIWGPYIGYNGSHQAYDGVGIYQNGGTLGAVAMGYRDNFFTGLTANISSNGCLADTMYGNESFAMLMSGIASKSGYNFELNNGKLIIQPNYLMSYTFVNTFPYKNGANVNIKPEVLNALQVAPGLQLIANLENGWQPFINGYMVWNIFNKSEFKANDISLPALGIKPFVLYGLGVRKIWGERATGFGQTYVTNGGRNGVGLNFGLRWVIGKI